MPGSGSDRDEGVAVDLGLADKRCIITGGSRGIGAATAAALLAEGASVALIARDAADLATAATRLRASGGGSVVTVSCDLSTAEGVETAVAEAIGGLGGVDVLVNNAGASPPGRLGDVTDDIWQESIDLKLLGYVRAMRAVMPHLRAQGSGVIVNVLGIAGTQASPGYVLACLNTALAHLTRSVAEEVAADGVRVVGIHPGPTATDRLLSMVAAGAEREGVEPAEYADRVIGAASPLGRIARPDEVAHLVAVLVSDVAGYVTGHSLFVDGGLAKGHL
ncbi:MAG: SDR family oxidoreductase [Acidimicrobiales bacterium]|nr:SDR family oxidoreductase [Acidimicrobiales bacterium]